MTVISLSEKRLISISPRYCFPLTERTLGLLDAPGRMANLMSEVPKIMRGSKF